MLDEKQIWAIFLFEFKMGCKATETTWNIYNAFDLGTAKEHIVQWWFKKSAKETRTLKMRSAEASPWKLTMTNWEQSSKLVLLKLHEKLLKNSASTILLSFGIWSKLERWKKSVSGCLMRWLRKKNRHFEVSPFILCNNLKPFLGQIVTCDRVQSTSQS